MPSRYTMLSILLCSMIQFSCERKIDPGLDPAPDILIIDGWINNKPESQAIKIKRSLPYFETRALPGISGGEVRVIREDGEQFIFSESKEKAGWYVWDPPTDTSVIGYIGDRYVLDVKIDGLQLGSFSEIRRVPRIDSITFKLASDNPILKGSFLAEFWSVDFSGAGDTYWIKAFKNGEFLNKPSEINIAWDAGFSRGDNIDGVTFNKLIRTGVNPYDQDDDGDIISPYVRGDSLFVEIHSITQAAYSYLFEVASQTNRPGGFAEIFAVPLANVGTNIFNVTNNDPVAGFFNVSAVNVLGRKFVEPD